MNNFSLHSEKIRLDISYESSAKQRIYIKRQALFSSKDRNKEFKVSSAPILIWRFKRLYIALKYQRFCFCSYKMMCYMQNVHIAFQTAKSQIRLRSCAVCSEPLQFAHTQYPMETIGPTFVLSLKSVVVHGRTNICCSRSHSKGFLHAATMQRCFFYNKI